MSDSRQDLETRKRDIYAALRTLDLDRQEGTIDSHAYLAARRRYEAEAADLLRRLDALDAPQPATSSAPAHTRWLIGGTATVVVAAIALFLGSSLRNGAGSASPTATPLVLSAAVRDAQATVKQHPHDVGALLTLGDAYMGAGLVSQANRAFHQAMKLAPSRPEAPTRLAFLLGSTGRVPQGLTLLESVEKSSPRYARAWLIDGLLSRQVKGGTAHAIQAWNRFLTLQPHTRVAATVRDLIVSARKALKKGK